MIIIAVIEDKVVEGQRQAAGKMLRKRVAIAAYPHGLAIATVMGESDVFIGQKYPHKLSAFPSFIAEYSDMTVEDFRRMAQTGLCTAFERKLDKDLTLEELDVEFAMTKRTPNSTGELQLYRTLQEKWAKNKDADEGDIVLWSGKGVS